MLSPEDSNGHWTQPIEDIAKKGEQEMDVTVDFHIKASEVRGLREGGQWNVEDTYNAVYHHQLVDHCFLLLP